MILRVLLLGSVLMLSGCVTPDKVAEDNRQAVQYEKVAARERAVGNKQIAEYWENEAKNKRKHDSDDKLLGRIYSLFIKGEEKKESKTW